MALQTHHRFQFDNFSVNFIRRIQTVDNNAGTGHIHAHARVFDNGCTICTMFDRNMNAVFLKTIDDVVKTFQLFKCHMIIFAVCTGKMCENTVDTDILKQRIDHNNTLNSGLDTLSIGFEADSAHSCIQFNMHIGNCVHGVCNSIKIFGHAVCKNSRHDMMGENKDWLDNTVISQFNTLINSCNSKTVSAHCS